MIRFRPVGRRLSAPCSVGGRRVRMHVGVAATLATVSLGLGAGDAQSAARGDSVTLNMVANGLQQPGWQVLISNFERAYPGITVNISYPPLATALYQEEAIELAAGDAPDLLATYPGCGTPISICLLARAGDLAPMVREPWVKRSIPLVTSNDKDGKGLFAFTPYVTPYGVFTNNNLFRQLGLNVPQTFSQLLDLCQKARAAGTVALILAGGSPGLVGYELTAFAVGTVYGPDKEWPAELRAGKVTFEGTAGWQQALQEFVDMNNAGCFQPGMTGTTTSAAQNAEFAEGQGLMVPGDSSAYGTIEEDGPQFGLSFYPFPGGTAPGQTTTYLQQSNSVSINAHSSPANQAAAQEFVDFVARPTENALFDRQVGGVGQYQFLHDQVPSFMSSFASVFANHAYVINPEQTWWNANVLLALEDGIGLVTGQDTIDGVLQAMDAAWQQGRP